ncbi:hypothetical protein Tco_1219834, partial [Tanacetum coccineum]
YQSNLKESHLTDVKRILKYLKEKPPQVPAKYLGGKIVCWSAKKQQSVAMSLAEAEYVAAASTVVAFDPFPSTDEPEKRPLKEFLIKFSVSNGQRHLTLDFKTFCSPSGLDYNNGKYVDHPTPEVVKKELGKIAINPSYLDKTPVLKNSFPVAWRILFTFMIQVLGGNYSSIEQVNSIQQLLAYSLITRTEVDIGEIIYSDLVTKLLNKSRLKYVSYPRFISCALQELLGSDYTQDKKFGFLPPILSNSNFIKDPSKVTEIELTAHMIAVNNRRDSVFLPPLVAKPKKGKSQTVAPTLPKSQGPEASGALSKKRNNLTIHLSEDEAQESDEEVLAAGDDMDDDPWDDKEVRTPSPKQAQPEPSHVQESASDSSSPDLKKFDNILPLTERKLIRDQTDKLVEASMSSLDRSSTTISDLYKVLNVVTQLLKEISNAVKDDPTINQKLNEATETFTRISSNVTEVLFLVKGFDFSALLKDTSEIKSMMTEMYAAFQGHSFLAPSGSVTPTLALTDIQANVKGENANTTATEEPPFHTEGETGEPRLEILISSIPSTAILPNLKPLTQSLNHHYTESSQATPKIDKGKGIAIESSDDPLKKLVKASSIIRPDLDEPVRVEFIINGRKVYLTKQEIQDYWDKEEQIKKTNEEARLNAISKPKVIKVVREEAKKLGIHPKEAITTKAGELFKKAQDAEHEVLKKQHTEKVRKYLDLRKHNRRDERLRQIPRELGIQSALPAPEQTLSQILRRKLKHMKLEPKTRIPGLECNRALPENVPFVNNMVIEEPDYFDKVGMKALVSYLVAASLVKSLENARFSMKLRKLIAEHPDQEKLESKKFKLEALGYNIGLSTYVIFCYLL